VNALLHPPRRSLGPALALLMGLLLPPLATPANPDLPRRVSSPAPVLNFSLPVFNDEGYHTLLVRGHRASLRDPSRIELADMTLTVFAGDPARTVESVLLSPRAVVYPEQERVEGPGPVRLVRDDVEVTGADWSYDHAAKKILINQRTRIVFQASLSNLLR
jgi:hypothetical protein